MKGLLLLPLLLAACKAAAVINATVYYGGRLNPRLVVGVVDKAKGLAYGYYEPSQNETGWDVLNVAAGYATATDYSDADTMFAAGFLEGALTQEQIWFLYQNVYADLLADLPSGDIDKLKGFYQKQREWMTEMITSLSAGSEFWYTVGLLYRQFEGLIAGYNSAAPESKRLDIFAFDFLNGLGDFLDIKNFLFEHRRPDLNTINRRELLSMMYRYGHCSALIKPLPGFENIFASHSSWFTYSSMNRVYKYYAFNIHNVTLPMKVMSFSSYPGMLESLDDFYIMDSGIVMIQTTNPVLNKTLYDLVTTQALLAWHRVRLANWMASGGEEWGKYLAGFNSGTYNNQYMVLDLKKVHLKQSIDDNALWVVEQIPGYVEYADVTEILRNGYWASYNIPFFERVYNLSGFPEAAKKMGPDVTYQLCPRAKIFRRDEGNVKNLLSMEYIMRYNDYKTDPYSEGSPMNTICSRGDLLDHPEAGGCYDTKITDYTMALALQAVAENGPTHQNLPPFDWTKSNLTDPHLGQPDLFNFGFIKMSPSVP